MSNVPTTTNVSARTNAPLFTLGAACVLIVLAIIAAIFIPARNQNTTDLLIAMIITAVPGLIAAGYSERTSRDMRNGVVEQKAKDGATKALQETGVTDVVEANGRGASSSVALQALDAHTQALTAIAQSLTQSTTPSVPSDTAPATETPSA